MEGALYGMIYSSCLGFVLTFLWYWNNLKSIGFVLQPAHVYVTGFTEDQQMQLPVCSS